MSNEIRENLIAEVAREVTEFQSASDLVDEAVAERLGLNRTDLRCLGLLYARGAMTAGLLAREGGLSPGAMTTALDRLERAGYARRVRHPEDRRAVLAETTPEAHHLIEELYGPVEVAGKDILERYSDDELALIRDFLRRGRELQVAHAERIRATADIEPAVPREAQ